jgi:UDPglucose 6-dehydrogenase
MKIGIVGLGFVGLCFASVLASKGYKVIGIDSDKQKIRNIKIGIPPFFEPKLEKFLRVSLKKNLSVSTQISSLESCDIVFLTVGTPQSKSGRIDLSIVKSAIEEIGKILKKTKNKPCIVIKSTVVPGTTRNLILPILEKESSKKAGKGFGLITNPEFLREGMAIDDAMKPHLVVLGGIKDKFLKKLEKFYRDFHSNVPTIVTNYENAELIKYANNSFLATKISFINQIANICQAVPGTNVEKVAEAIGYDPRIGKLFLNAGPGYGGSCLPKDIKALTNFASSIGIKPTLLNAVEQVNRNQIKNIIKLIEKSIGKVKGKYISILGVAFKPETDDIRDSASIELIKALLKNDAKIILHDPKAIKNAKNIFGDKIAYANSIKNALRNSQCCVIMTSWKQYSRIQKNDLKIMKKPVVVDSRRMLEKNASDIEYHAVGIGT